MKRCIKWLINWFAQWIGKMRWEERIGFLFGAVVGLVIGIMLFVSIDTVPATPMDYKPLEEQMTAVQQNPQLLLETNCNVEVEEDMVTVLFRNDECSITAKYDKELKLISCSKADESMFGLKAVILTVFIGVVVYGGCAFLFTALIYGGEIAWEFIGRNMQLKLSKAKK